MHTRLSPWILGNPGRRAADPEPVGGTHSFLLSRCGCAPGPFKGICSRIGQHLGLESCRLKGTLHRFPELSNAEIGTLSPVAFPSPTFIRVLACAGH